MGIRFVLRGGESETDWESCRLSLVWPLEVLDDAFVLIRLYHGHPQ